MSYNLKFEKKNNILWVTATGARSLQTVLDITKDIIAACADSQIKKVLLNVCALKGRLSNIDAYEIPARYFPGMRDRSTITQVAIVDRKQLEESDKFFENVAVNRGFMLRFFSDTAEAIKWLND
jgi:predicted GTPase